MKVFAIYPTLEFINGEYLDNSLVLIDQDGEILTEFRYYNTLEYLRKKNDFDPDEFKEQFSLTFDSEDFYLDRDCDFEQYAKTVVKKLFDLDIVKLIYI